MLADHRLFFGDKIELPNFKFVLKSFDVKHRVIHKDGIEVLFINFRVLQNLGLKDTFSFVLIEDLHMIDLVLSTRPDQDILEGLGFWIKVAGLLDAGLIIFSLDRVIKLHSSSAEVNGFHVCVFEENLICRERIVVVLFPELIEFLVIGVALPKRFQLGVKKSVFSSQLEIILVELWDIYRELCFKIIHILLIALQVEGSLLITLGNKILSWSLSKVSVEIPLNVLLSHHITLEIFAIKISRDYLAHSETSLRVEIVSLHLSSEGLSHDG